MDDRIVTARYFFDSVGNLAQGSTVARRLDSRFQQVAVVPAFGGCRNGV